MRWRGRWSALAGALVMVAAAPAQEVVQTHVVGDRQLVTVRTRVVAGAPVPGGAGFVRLEASNLDDRGHAVAVDIRTMRWSGGGDAAVRQVFALAANERAVAFLPLPTPFPDGEIRLEVDGHAQSNHLSVQHGAAVHGLLITDRTDAAADGLAMLQALPSAASDPPAQALVRGDEVPADWRLFTGFHAVVVDGRAALPGAPQEALRRYTFAGGTILVAAADLLPAGPLRELATGATEQGRIRHGLGVVVVTDQLGGESTALRALLAPLPQVQDGPWPANRWLGAEQPIPGLGRAPVTLFLVIILVFAAVAGPMNFAWLRRRRQPQLALLTLPVLGFGTTLVILGFGLLNDGFGVRGVVQSWTLLDQGRREFAAVAARTLFAGLAPAASTMGPDTLLLAPRVVDAYDRRPDRWHYDHGTQRLDGVLPSRVATPLVTVQQAVARQRVRVQLQADGALQVSAEGGIAPVGTIVLRDFDGEFWVGTAPQLQKVTAAVAAREAGTLRRAGQAMTVRAGGSEPSAVPAYYRGYVEEESPVLAAPRDPGPLAERATAEPELPPGSYLMRVGTAPWLDEHGFGVDYDEQRHFLFGRLQREDFVR
ncbi:MAG: hypothetical protein MUC36_26725 [Planctomycetes bacterium]|jgi:hypothetical protein|nr:hypothetical protein [Planctomycetota bacterium]